MLTRPQITGSRPLLRFAKVVKVLPKPQIALSKKFKQPHQNLRISQHNAAWQIVLPKHQNKPNVQDKAEDLGFDFRDPVQGRRC